MSARFMQTLLLTIYCGLSIAEVKTFPDVPTPGTCKGQDGDSCKASYGSDSHPDETNLLQTHVQMKMHGQQQKSHPLFNRSDVGKAHSYGPFQTLSAAQSAEQRANRATSDTRKQAQHCKDLIKQSAQKTCGSAPFDVTIMSAKEKVVGKDMAMAVKLTSQDGSGDKYHIVRCSFEAPRSTSSIEEAAGLSGTLSMKSDICKAHKESTASEADTAAFRVAAQKKVRARPEQVKISQAALSPSAEEFCLPIYEIFDAGWGPCYTYAKWNKPWCDFDMDPEGHLASAVCKECGSCIPM